VTKRPWTLHPVDIQILRAVNRFRYVTAAQLNRLFWPDNTRDKDRYAQRRLQRLVEDQYVLPLRELPRPTSGTAPRVHALAWRGRKVLLELGDDVPSYYRPSETREAAENPLFMPHTLAVIDVLIAAERLTQEVVSVYLTQLLLERDLRRMGLRVTVPPIQVQAHARRVTVVPDAIFSFEVDGVEQHFILELDRDTERAQAWRNKVAALALWLDSTSSRHSLPSDYRTVIVAVPTNRRREQLREWTALELKERSLYDTYAPIFVFSEISPVSTTPLDFFAGAHWYPAYLADPEGLIDI
jgi:hypothetical protein